MSRIHHHHPHVAPHPKPATTPDAAQNAQVAAALSQVAQALSQAVSTFAQQAPGSAGAVAPPPFSGSPWTCLPPPAPEQSSPPAGVGLTVGGSQGADFGPNAVHTAGGYTIVPQGKDAGWDVFAPGQKPGDTPNTHVWGDPHVTEADGTRWDFTKNSSFRLPDGTNISVGTTKQDGYSVSSKLDITNGADHVVVSGIETGKPSTAAATHDGFKARADLAKEDTFVLGGDTKNVKWFKETEGKIEGEVVGASMTTKDGVQQYVQKVNADSQYVVDPSLQPKVGSEAWGNKLRDEAVDAARGTFGSGSAVAETVAKGADKDNTEVLKQQEAQRAKSAQLQQLLQAIQQLVKLLGMLSLGGGSLPNIWTTPSPARPPLIQDPNMSYLSGMK